MRTLRISLSLAALALVPAMLAAQNTYHVTKRLKLGGEGGWDYLTVDSDAHRLYISRGTHVMVVDLDTDSLVGDIPNTLGVHGVAIAKDLGKGFTSNGRDSSVTIFDLKTLAVTSVVHGTGRNPDAILYEPTTKRVFTFNGGSASATAIDATNGKIVGTVALGGKPETGNYEGGKIYVNVEDKNEVVKFDAKSLTVDAHWPVKDCDEPTGQSMDTKTGHLFVGCGGNKTIAVINYKDGSALTTIPAGEGIDATGWDASTSLVFASGGDGTITVVHQAGNQFHPLGKVDTMRGARTMTLDPRTHRLYTVSAEFGPRPEPTADQPRPRPPMVPGSFTLIVLEK